MVTCPILRLDLYINNKRLCLVTMMIIIVVGYLILKFALNIKKCWKYQLLRAQASQLVITCCT